MRLKLLMVQVITPRFVFIIFPYLARYIRDKTFNGTNDQNPVWFYHFPLLCRIFQRQKLLMGQMIETRFVFIIFLYLASIIYQRQKLLTGLMITSRFRF